MATTPTTQALKVSELDFDQVKNAFKTFLQNQNQFTDYNFEGSGLSVLLDVLAYNTHYNGVYANMLASEMFLDSAVVRENVVSRAKKLGYTPTSRRSATVNVNVTFSSPASATAGYSSLTIPRYTKFSTSLGNRTYTFLNPEVATATLVDPYGARTDYTAIDVPIKEGVYFSESYISTGTPTQKFTIQSANVDTSTVEVAVNGSTFRGAVNYNEVKSTSNVYFIQEGSQGNYEVYFGDGNVGRALNSGDSVFVTYITTLSGSEGNGARSFQAAENFKLIENSESAISISVTLANSDSTYAASGGTEKESIDSIKFLAPLNYESQSRAVTTEDYRSRILNDIPGVDSVNVWGGEYNNPPEYGKVFISLKPKSGYAFSALQKENIKNILKKQNVVSVLPTLIEPDYLYPVLDVQVMYNPSEKSIATSDLMSMVSSTISTYSENELNKFNSYFRSSILGGLIDVTERSIKNHLMAVKLRKYFMPTLNTNLDYLLKFSNPIFHPHAGHMSVLSSTLFSYLYDNDLYLDCSLDDADGVVRVVQTNIDGSKTVIKNSGTVDYTSGVVDIQNFTPYTINDGTNMVSVTVQPGFNDIIPAFNQIVSIDPNDVTITMVDDTNLTSTERPGAPGTFTASRGTYSTTDTGTGSSSGGTGY